MENSNIKFEQWVSSLKEIFNEALKNQAEIKNMTKKEQVYSSFENAILDYFYEKFNNNCKTS
jgi:hypothetical protein